MEIRRYKLSQKEHAAIANMARTIGAIEADKEIISNFVTVEGSRRDVTRLHYVNPRVFKPEDNAVMDGLQSRLAKSILWEHPRPLVLVENVPLELPVACMILLGQMHGMVQQYNLEGAAIDSVMDCGNMEDCRPRSSNRLRFPLHTDLSFSEKMPSSVSFLMVNPATIGGASIFCSIYDVVNSLSRETVVSLSKPFRFLAPPHRPDKRPIDMPIFEFTWHGKRPAILVRWREDGIELTGSACEQDAKRAALAEFKTSLARHAVSIRLGRGEWATWDNREILHGREEFANADKPRLGLRAYLLNAA